MASATNRDNIPDSTDDVMAEIERIDTQIIEPAAISTTSPPPHSPSAADSYINDIYSWAKSDSTYGEVINVTPASISQVGRGISVRPPSYAHVTFAADTRDDDSAEMFTGDIEEKVDAIYDKLCSLATINSESVEESHQFNDQLESVHNTLVESIRSSNESSKSIRKDISLLSAQVAEIRCDIADIKGVLSQLMNRLSAITEFK